MIGPLLTCIEAMVVLMIYLLVEKFEEDSSVRARVFSIILIVICSAAALILLVLSALVMKQLCFAKKLTRWSILNCEVLEDKQDDTTFIVLNQDFVMERPQEELVVPERVNVGGVPVLTPEMPPLRMNRANSGSQLLALVDPPAFLNASQSENHLIGNR